MKWPTIASTRLVLLVAVGLPVVALFWRAVALSFWNDPVLVCLSDGRQILSIPLPRDRVEEASGFGRHLLADGEVRSLPDSDISWIRPVSGIWTIRTEDGPVRLGRIVAVVQGPFDTLRAGDLDGAVERMREGRRADREALLGAVRSAEDATEFASAMRRWDLFRKADARAGFLLSSGSGDTVFLAASSVRRMTKSGVDWWARSRDRIVEVADVLAGPPDAWGLGGLKLALVGTFLLIVMSGSIGGTLALLAALLLNERLRDGRWARVVRRSSEWLAAVPGVVWGVVGYGFLVSVVGREIDRFSGGGLRWGTGGLLWASATLGILAAPLSLRRALAALEAVPRQWRLIARSCGATRWQVLRMVVLPAAWPGLAGAWLAAFARAAGETAPLLLVGAVHSVGGDLFETGIGLPDLSGGFPHLGVLACDPPWPSIEAELGHPVAHLSLLVLSCMCIGFELLAGTFDRRSRAVPRGEIS